MLMGVGECKEENVTMHLIYVPHNCIYLYKYTSLLLHSSEKSPSLSNLFNVTKAQVDNNIFCPALVSPLAHLLKKK